MKGQFLIALLSMACNATNLPDANQAEFMGFAGAFNKHYRTTEELVERMQVYSQNKAVIDELKANDQSEAQFEINETADLTDEEFHMMQGVDANNLGDIEGNTETVDSDDEFDEEEHGRHLSHNINWSRTKYASPVKNQGGCGSCWAFAATTVQETMQAIKRDTTAVRLSEQEGVDCDHRSSGCAGGSPYGYWQMSHEIGSQAYADYPYESQKGACRHQQGKKIASKVATQEWVRYTNGDAANIARIKSKLQQGPLVAHVAAGNNCWRFYKGGLLTAQDHCPSKIDHAVAIVGMDQQNGKDYWIVQNSWSAQWGESGNIRIAVENGQGISGINVAVGRVEVDGAFPLAPKKPGCDINEATNARGANRCWKDQECAGARTCSAWGWCQGTSGC